MLDSDSEVVSYDRSPVDLFRLVVWAAAATAVAFATRYLRAGTDGIEENLSSLLTVDSANVRVALDVLLLATSVIATLVVLIIPLVTRRWRLFGYVFSANILASIAIALVNLWVGDLDTVGVAASAAQDGLGLDMSTDVTAATQMIAAFVAVAPFVSNRWRRLGMWLVGVLMVLRLVVAPGTSTHALLVLSIGTAVGSGVLLLFGRPSTQPRASSILEALNSSGIAAATIQRASVDARGSVPWFAETADGEKLFVKVLGTDQRAADLLFRIYRMLRLRNVGDERPFSSLRRTVEHEALVALAARDVGVHTPRLRAMATIGRESFLLTYDRIEGRSIDELPEEALTDQVLTGIWEQAAILREHRIAHRDLRLANVFLTSSAEPLIIDFGFSEIAVDDALLEADLAQLLVSLALATGVQRSTAAAISVLGPERVAGTLGRMQPAAMSGATQSSLKSRKGLLEELRHEIEQSSGVEPPALEPVTRITPFAVAGLVVMVGIIYLLVPHLADLPGLFGDLTGVDPWWTIPALGTTAAAYVAASIVFVNSVQSRVPAGPTFISELATAFTGRFQPTGVGAISVRVRYLQRQGVDASAADRAAALGLLAGVVTQVALAGIFVLWLARDTGGSIVVSPRAALLSATTVALLGLTAMAFPQVRKSVTRTTRPVVAQLGAGFRAQFNNPAKLSWVFMGAAAQRLLYAGAFFYVTQAFGLTYGFATVASVNLVGSGFAAIAPTPGGLGTVEVALVGGLMMMGVDSATAVPTVFLYRLITFWFPLLPGWAASRWLRRSEQL